MTSRNSWLAVAVLGAIFATNANAQTEMDKLRGCLTIADASKERLDCYATLLGALLAIMRTSQRRWLWMPAMLYIEVLRNIPALLLVFNRPVWALCWQISYAREALSCQIKTIGISLAPTMRS